jgi:hypothetical protein
LFTKVVFSRARIQPCKRRKVCGAERSGTEAVALAAPVNEPRNRRRGIGEPFALYSLSSPHFTAIGRWSMCGVVGTAWAWWERDRRRALTSRRTQTDPRRWRITDDTRTRRRRTSGVGLLVEHRVVGGGGTKRPNWWRVKEELNWRRRQLSGAGPLSSPHCTAAAAGRGALVEELHWLALRVVHDEVARVVHDGDSSRAQKTSTSARMAKDVATAAGES